MDEDEAIELVKRIFPNAGVVGSEVQREVIDEEADRYWGEIQGRE